MDEKVAAGDLTQDQADELTADLVDRITRQVEERTFRDGPGGVHGPRGFADPDEAGSDGGATEESTDQGTTENPTGGTSFDAVTYGWV
ncbi:hypothetical protein [Georgenia yuyongxinii]